jgi:hypothetical protein
MPPCSAGSSPSAPRAHTRSAIPARRRHLGSRRPPLAARTPPPRTRHPRPAPQHRPAVPPRRSGPRPTMARPQRVYLAGPEVFLADARAIGDRKRAICTRYGLFGIFPGDAEPPRNPTLTPRDSALAIRCERTNLTAPDTGQCPIRQTPAAQRHARRTCQDCVALEWFSDFGRLLLPHDLSGQIPCSLATHEPRPRNRRPALPPRSATSSAPAANGCSASRSHRSPSGCSWPRRWTTSGRATS